MTVKNVRFNDDIGGYKRSVPKDFSFRDERRDDRKRSEDARKQDRRLAESRSLKRESF